ncbi:MAG: thioredoxin family protein [bacterium]
MTLTTHEPMVTFTLPGVDGKTYGPESFAETPALAVIFWCNHCPYVRAWEDRVIALAQEYADRGVQFLLINSNDPAKYPDDSFEQMTVRAREKGYPFPYLFDESQAVARQYGATRTPEIFLFDRDRTLRYHGATDDSVDDPAAVRVRFFRDAIEAVLGGRAPEVAETPPRGCTIKWR